MGLLDEEKIIQYIDGIMDVSCKMTLNIEKK